MEKIKVGVFGIGRGTYIAKDFMLAGCEIVAACDCAPNLERNQGYFKQLQEMGAKFYDNFDAFIEHDMDAVILTNAFHEHAPYAIKCFEKGLHVYSECISNGTMAEGVELIRAFEKSNVVYLLAENYPQMKMNRELQRICKSGTMGKIVFAEGEYNHPHDYTNDWIQKDIFYYEKHWRNYIPRTYYITHSLGPLMCATGATPRKVSAFATFAPPEGEGLITADNTGDRAAIIMTYNDDESIYRVTACSAFGGQENSYRICGTKGEICNIRGSMGEKILRRHGTWCTPEGIPSESIYEPGWNDPDEELIWQSGHGGGDFITARMFVNCIREGKQPEHPFDIYGGTTMSSVGILAWRSVLNGGEVIEIPDFHKEEDRKKYENDRLTPFWSFDGTVPPTLPCCSHPDYKVDPEHLENYRKVMGTN